MGWNNCGRLLALRLVHCRHQSLECSRLHSNRRGLLESRATNVLERDHKRAAARALAGVKGQNKAIGLRELASRQGREQILRRMVIDRHVVSSKRSLSRLIASRMR